MITLEQVKQALRVTHAEDDDNLGRLIASATRECLQFLGTDDIPENEPDVENGIVLMVSADYDADPSERERYRKAAEMLWTPHRTGLGV